MINKQAINPSTLQPSYGASKQRFSGHHFPTIEDIRAQKHASQPQKTPSAVNSTPLWSFQPTQKHQNIQKFHQHVAGATSRHTRSASMQASVAQVERQVIEGRKGAKGHVSKQPSISYHNDLGVSDGKQAASSTTQALKVMEKNVSRWSVETSGTEGGAKKRIDSTQPTYFEFEKLRRNQQSAQDTHGPTKPSKQQHPNIAYEPLHMAHGAPKYCFQQPRFSALPKQVSPLAERNLSAKNDFSTLKARSVTKTDVRESNTVDYQNLKNVKNRIYEKKVYDNKLAQMLSKRSKTPQAVPNYQKRDYLAKCMQPQLEKNKMQECADIGLLGNGRTLVSHNQNDIPNYQKQTLQNRDPLLSSVKIDKDRKNQLFSSILVESRKINQENQFQRPNTSQDVVNSNLPMKQSIQDQRMKLFGNYVDERSRSVDKVKLNKETLKKRFPRKTFNNTFQNNRRFTQVINGDDESVRHCDDSNAFNNVEEVHSARQYQAERSSSIENNRYQPQFSHYFVNMLKPHQLQAKRENHQLNSKSQDCMNRKSLNATDSQEMPESQAYLTRRYSNLEENEPYINQEAPPQFTSFFKPRATQTVSSKITDTNVHTVQNNNASNNFYKLPNTYHDYDSGQYLKGIGTNHSKGFQKNQTKFEINQQTQQAPPNQTLQSSKQVNSFNSQELINEQSKSKLLQTSRRNTVMHQVAADHSAGHSPAQRQDISPRDFPERPKGPFAGDEAAEENAHEQTVIYCESAKAFEMSSGQKEALGIVTSTYDKVGDRNNDCHSGQKRQSQTLSMENFGRKNQSNVHERVAQEDTHYLMIEFDSLPEGTDDLALRRMYLKNMHVIESEQEVNNINGKFTGKAKVKVRCQSGLKSDIFLKKLYKKGAKFRVRDRVKHNDFKSTSKSFNKSQKNLNQIDGVSHKRNFWLRSSMGEEEVIARINQPHTIVQGGFSSYNSYQYNKIKERNTRNTMKAIIQQNHVQDLSRKNIDQNLCNPSILRSEYTLNGGKTLEENYNNYSHLANLQLSTQESGQNTASAQNRESTFNNTMGSNHHQRKSHSPLHNLRQIQNSLIEDSDRGEFGAAPRSGVTHESFPDNNCNLSLKYQNFNSNQIYNIQHQNQKNSSKMSSKNSGFKCKQEPVIMAPNQMIHTNISISNDKILAKTDSIVMNHNNDSIGREVHVNSNNINTVQQLSSTTRQQSTAAASRFTITHHGSHQIENGVSVAQTSERGTTPNGQQLLQSVEKSRNSCKEFQTAMDDLGNKGTQQATNGNANNQELVDQKIINQALDGNYDNCADMGPAKYIDNLDASQCINLKFANSNKLENTTGGQSTTGASFNMTNFAAAAVKSTEQNMEHQKNLYTMDDQKSIYDQTSMPLSYDQDRTNGANQSMRRQDKYVGDWLKQNSIINQDLQTITSQKSQKSQRSDKHAHKHSQHHQQQYLINEPSIFKRMETTKHQTSKQLYPVSTMIQKTISIGNLNSGRDVVNISQASTQKSNYFSEKNGGSSKAYQKNGNLLQSSSSVGKASTGRHAKVIKQQAPAYQNHGPKFNVQKVYNPLENNNLTNNCNVRDTIFDQGKYSINSFHNQGKAQVQQKPTNQTQIKKSKSKVKQKENLGSFGNPQSRQLHLENYTQNKGVFSNTTQNFNQLNGNSQQINHKTSSNSCNKHPKRTVNNILTQTSQILAERNALSSMVTASAIGAATPGPAKKSHHMTMQKIMGHNQDQSAGNGRQRQGNSGVQGKTLGLNGQTSKQMRKQKGTSPRFMEMTKSCKNRLMFA